ncbi:MAG: hypothetical protein ABGW95_00975 [Candidatus Poseidoniia archaeon]
MADQHPAADTELEERELQPAISRELLRLYVGYARKLRPVMTSQTQQKLKDHYTSMRRSYQQRGEEEEQVFPITPRQLESLIRLAEADARMHLSHTVGPENADRAIEMLTLFLTITLHGDIDMAFDLLTPKQRKQKEDPLALIIRFIRKGGAEGADELEILDRLEEQGFSRANGEKYLQQLSKDGRILSPAHGRWRTM